MILDGSGAVLNSDLHVLMKADWPSNPSHTLCSERDPLETFNRDGELFVLRKPWHLVVTMRHDSALFTYFHPKQDAYSYFKSIITVKYGIKLINFQSLLHRSVNGFKKIAHFFLKTPYWVWTTFFSLWFKFNYLYCLGWAGLQADLWFMSVR